MTKQLSSKQLSHEFHCKAITMTTKHAHKGEKEAIRTQKSQFWFYFYPDCITAAMTWAICGSDIAFTDLQEKNRTSWPQPETEPTCARLMKMMKMLKMKFTWQLADQYHDVPSCGAESTSHHATSCRWLLSHCFTFTIIKKRNTL